MIKVENVSYIYNEGMPFEQIALKDICFQIKQGEFIGLIGHTGSGKSTLVQMLNGLIKPSRGKIFINNKDITEKGVNLVSVRQKVGLVFQYPEYQLFEETIYKDISYGLINLDTPEELIEDKVKWAMELVGLDYEKMKDLSPFEISGGQQRRVAIAGVLVMQPDVLILDEPTAGLDPFGRDEILDQISSLQKNEDITIILVSHSMEDIARLVDRVLVLNKGEIVIDKDTRSAFQEIDILESIGLGVPDVTKFMHIYGKSHNVRTDVLTVKEVEEEILNVLRSKNV